MPSKQYETAMAFLGDFATLDVDMMLSRRTDDCIHIFLPASLGMTPKDKATFGAHINGLKEVLQSFSVTPVTGAEVFEDEAKHVVIVHATAVPQFKEELKDDGISAEEWTYQGEYIFILTMTDDGEKVTAVKEFLDSKGTGRARELLRRAASNKEKAIAAKA